MSTTVEINEDTHARIKKARDLIYEKYRIQMRMPDLMEHIVREPEDIVRAVMESINKANNDRNM